MRGGRQHWAEYHWAEQHVHGSMRAPEAVARADRDPVDRFSAGVLHRRAAHGRQAGAAQQAKRGSVLACLDFHRPALRHRAQSSHRFAHCRPPRRQRSGCRSVSSLPRGSLAQHPASDHALVEVLERMGGIRDARHHRAGNGGRLAHLGRPVCHNLPCVLILLPRPRTCRLVHLMLRGGAALRGFRVPRRPGRLILATRLILGALLGSLRRHRRRGLQSDDRLDEWLAYLGLRARRLRRTRQFADRNVRRHLCSCQELGGA
mmetsp:Transcript_11664/g.19909  ORF Transcript_11664/g.19909 Transcript_11664/m.19909 type:complete len:261 (+) Transcript_11664:3001-3783(+)